MSLANEPESGPAVETVTLAEAKSHAIITITDDDPDITAYITLARRYAEDRTGRVFVNQTWKDYYDVFPDDGVLRLSKSPVQSPIISIKYIDVDGVERTIDASIYQVDYISEPSRIKPAYNQSWPSVRGGTLNAITVEFVAGYGAAAVSVPDRFKMSIKLLVAHWYRMREPTTLGPAIHNVPMAVDTLLRGDKLYQF